MKIFLILLLLGFAVSDSLALPAPWAHAGTVTISPEGVCRVTGGDPWLQFAPFDPPIGADNAYLLMEFSAKQPTNMRLWWFRHKDLPVNTKSFLFTIPAGERIKQAVDLGVLGPYKPNDLLRLYVDAPEGTELAIHSVRPAAFGEIPADLLPGLIDFRCFTSKLHYLPGGPIEFRATMFARSYPDRESAKVLRVKLLDEKNNQVAEHLQHYGIQPLHSIKELFGVLRPEKELKPGKYRVEATSRDLRSGMTLTSTHDFGIQGENDPLLCETPFKFVKDFSLIRDHNGLWHVFSITGDFVGSHEWLEDGQERTFSHATSTDLRHWTWHEPVISISNDTYAGCDLRFKDRNVWAPHVIRHGDTYYMFYTTINAHTAQCISLANTK